MALSLDPADRTAIDDIIILLTDFRQEIVFPILALEVVRSIGIAENRKLARGIEMPDSSGGTAWDASHRHHVIHSDYFIIILLSAIRVKL